MKSIFLSYSSRDYFFAEMLAIKLAEEGYAIWRDQGSIRAGDDWRQTIDEGIKECLAVVVALSADSAQSNYVTYEWAYAAGMGKPVIPVKLSECSIHPRLEPTQYIDFSYPRSLPWDALVQRLAEVDPEAEASTTKPSKGKKVTPVPPEIDTAAGEIMHYLNSQGFSRVSFERLRQRIGKHLTDALLESLIQSRPTVFRHATIKGGKPGIAKQIP